MKASVLIAAYNNQEFLRKTLVGLTRQTELNFETIICDDGSGPEIKALAEEFISRLPGAVIHCRHQDSGFRKCKILNEGVLASRSDYLIFLDPDCVPHKRFVEEHLYSRREGHYLVGRRVQLCSMLTGSLTEELVLAGHLENFFVTGVAGMLRGNVRHVEAGVYYPKILELIRYRGSEGLKGCNFSCWKKDLEAINGFNEEFVHCGGGEDDDVERRFKMIGLSARSVKHVAICYHLYHELLPRTGESAMLCEKLREEGSSFCECGLKEHGKSGKKH